MASTNKEIKIHYDIDFNFYVEIILVGKKELPDFGSMNPSQKLLLANAFPKYGELIMDPNLDPDASSEEIKQITPLIEEYNKECKRSNITRIYKVSKQYKFDSIDPSQMPTYRVEHLSYDGSDYNDEIIAFIKDKEKELKEERYAVFECDECKKIQFAPIISNKVRCDNCKKEFPATAACKEIKAIFSSQTNNSPRTAAIIKYRELLKNNSKVSTKYGDDDEIDFKGLFPFTYNDIVYKFSFPEFELLHKSLYDNFACDAILEFKDKENIGFKDSYLKYLKCLYNNNVRKDLYENAKRKITNEINSTFNSINTIEKAFYWYFNNYDLNKNHILIWRLGSHLYKFETLEDYVNTFLSAEQNEKLNLLQLFNELTSQENNLFYGYDPSKSSEISRLIYEISHRFIYISNNNIIDFGKDFLNQLHLQDEMIPTRNIFIESIMDNYKFKEQIHASDIGSYYGGSDETYYDRLCYYEFALSGRRLLKYKSLRIKNSQDGFKTIKNIIINTYLTDSDESRKQFHDLVELSENQDLCASLDLLSPVSIRFDFGTTAEEINFETLREELSKTTNDIPSIALYLKCIDLTANWAKKIKVRFKNRINTFNDHLKYILDTTKQGKPLMEAINAFYNDSDINYLIKFAVNPSGLDDTEFNNNCGDKFNKIIKTIEELQSKFKKQRNEALKRDKSGR